MADFLKFQLLFSRHSLDRITVWGLKVEQVLDALLFQEEVVTISVNVQTAIGVRIINI